MIGHYNAYQSLKLCIKGQIQSPSYLGKVSRKSIFRTILPKKERDIPTNETSLEAFPHVEDGVLNMNRLDWNEPIVGTGRNRELTKMSTVVIKSHQVSNELPSPRSAGPCIAQTHL